uniref:Syntaxin binding protein 4 n=1 Tax=Nothobranchius rachovii TaxID=451742 RepID=A0A1A8S3G2_9TELE
MTVIQKVFCLYLQVRVSQARTEPTCVSSPPASDSSSDTNPDPSTQPPQRKCSLSAGCRFKMERLEQALDLIGLKPTDTQRQLLRSRLLADVTGTVAFADFESLIRELFKPQLDELFATQSGSSFTCDDLCSLLESPTNPPPLLSDSDDLEEMERLRKEHIEALREIKRLQEQLVESQRVHQDLEEEFSKVKQEVKVGAEESRALKTRIQLAEEAQKQARGMEMDYEEVIHLLEAEIAELKTQSLDHPAPKKEETEELKKRVAVLECQLRKSDAAKKEFRDVNRKTAKFCGECSRVSVGKSRTHKELQRWRCESRLFTSQHPFSLQEESRDGSLTRPGGEGADTVCQIHPGG